VVADQIHFSASCFQVFRLDLDLCRLKREMEKCPVARTDLQSLSIRRILDYVDECYDIAHRRCEVQAELRRGVLGPGFQPLLFVQVFDSLWRFEILRVVLPLDSIAHRIPPRSVVV
jgi:hypothetical protein